MWKQVEGFKSAIYPVLRNAAQGVHFICYSQGLNVLNIWFICYLFCHFSIRLTCTVNNNTLFFVFLAGGLVCRGILSTLPDHNVQTFISLSSPQAGQYGGKWDFWSHDFYTETCLNPSWCLCLFLLPRHGLFEVPLPSLLQVQPLPYLLHCFWSDDLHLQLLEWWEFWNIFVSVLWPCVDGKLNSANRKKNQETFTSFDTLLWFSLLSSSRPSPQRQICEQQWVLGSAQQWEAQSKFNRLVNLWIYD